VISEAERAADDGKLITLRTPDIPLQRIPMPFGVRHTELVDNRAAVLAAVRSCGARARKPAAGVPPPVSAAAMESGSSAGGSPASWGDLGQAAGWIVAVAAALVGGIVLINGWSGSDPKERLRGFSDSKAFPGSSPEAGSVREGVEAEWGRAAPGMDAVPSPSAGGGPTN
jgi:hypothetical protein